MPRSILLLINNITQISSCFFSAWLLLNPAAGCAPVAGNYPELPGGPWAPAVRLAGDGFLVQAGSRLELDRIRADLGLLRAQGFSPRDPGILDSVARRERVPVSLLGDGSAVEYYRVRFRVAPGRALHLKPGAVKLTLQTRDGRKTVRDLGYLIEDPRHRGGCRPVPAAGLEIEGSRSELRVLVRAGLRGEIVGLTLEPHLVTRR
jgi:hypothetical protein